MGNERQSGGATTRRRRGQCNGRCTEWDDHKGVEWEMWVCCKEEDWHCKAFVRSQTGSCGGLGGFHRWVFPIEDLGLGSVVCSDVRARCALEYKMAPKGRFERTSGVFARVRRCGDVIV